MLGKPCIASWAGPTSPVGQVLPLLLGRPHCFGWVGHDSQLGRTSSLVRQTTLYQLDGWAPPSWLGGPHLLVEQALPHRLGPTIEVGGPHLNSCTDPTSLVVREPHLANWMDPALPV